MTARAFGVTPAALYEDIARRGPILSQLPGGFGKENQG